MPTATCPQSNAKLELQELEITKNKAKLDSEQTVLQNKLGASTAELTTARQEIDVLEEMLETTNTEMRRLVDTVQVYECQFGAVDAGAAGSAH